MKDTTLRGYLADDEVEIRRAAALAAAARGSKVLIPDLIRRLSDPEELVQRAAHTALKELTKEDFGPSSRATAAERKEAVAAWLKWWKANSRE
jgi:HEAT repeat protein